VPEPATIGVVPVTITMPEHVGYGAPMDTESDIRELKHGLSELARAVEELADAVEDAVQGRTASEMSGARSASHTARQIAQRFT